MLELTKSQVKDVFLSRNAFIFLMFLTTVVFLFLLKFMFLWFFFRGGALLGERVKGQISDVIPAMVTKSEIENEVHRAKTELHTSHILVLFSGKPRNRKDTRVWELGILFSSPSLSFSNFFPKGDRPCLHTCFNGFLSKMVWKWMTTNLPFTRLRIIQEYQLELKESNERLENR